MTIAPPPIADPVAAPRRLFLIAAAGMILLSGCSRSAPERAPDEEKTTVDATPAPMPAAAPIAKPPAERTARAEIPRAEEPAPEVQMQDDADATGMTARVSHDDASAENMDAPPDPAKGD